MKLLVLLFLVGYAAAASIGDGLDRTAEAAVQELLGDTSTLIQRAEGDEDIKTELGKKLRETLDHILERVKEALEHGKTIREDTIEKIKEIREKLKDLKMDLGEKAKELIQKIKDRAKDFLKKILERLGLDKDKEAKEQAAVFMRSVERMIQEAEGDDDVQTELGKKLREHLDEILEKIKDAIERGKTVKEDVIQKLKDLREKMKEHKIELGKKAKELIEKLKEKAKDFWKDLLEKITGKREEDNELSADVSRAEGKMREFLRKLKKSILETIDKEKLKEKIEQFFGKGTEMGERMKELLEKGKDKVLKWIEKVLGDDEERETR